MTILELPHIYMHDTNVHMRENGGAGFSLCSHTSEPALEPSSFPSPPGDLTALRFLPLRYESLPGSLEQHGGSLSQHSRKKWHLWVIFSSEQGGDWSFHVSSTHTLMGTDESPSHTGRVLTYMVCG